MPYEGPADPTAWWRYVEAGLKQRGWSATEFAKRAGIHPSQVNKWRDRGARVTPDFARRVAETFGDTVTTAYVAADILRRDEIEQPINPIVDLAAVHSDVLFAELRRRVRDFGNTVDIPSDEEIAAHPERYSEGRLSLDDEDQGARRGATGPTPAG